MPDQDRRPKIAFLGFGEAAGAIVAGWRQVGLSVDISAFDIKTNDQNLAPETAARCAALDVVSASSPRDALEHAEAVFCLVTADQALVAATSAAPHLAQGAFYFDCNSCSPGTKRSAAEQMANANATYVDVAIMSPIHPGQHRSPLLLSGECAKMGAAYLTELNMNPDIIEGDIGSAASVKMIRSVMVKGLEALTAECMLAAEKANVSGQIIQSLDRSYPEFGWMQRSTYNFGRMMEHGVRRAAEMLEAAKTIEQLGLDNAMSKSIIKWQQTIGDLELDPGPKDFHHRAELILDKLEEKTNGPK